MNTLTDYSYMLLGSFGRTTGPDGQRGYIVRDEQAARYYGGADWDAAWTAVEEAWDAGRMLAGITTLY